MKLKNNQDGAAHLAAILAVVVLVVIGVVGWKVWENKKSNNNPTTTTNKKNVKISTISGTAPVIISDTSDPKNNVPFCDRKLMDDGTGYNLYDSPVELYTFKNSKSGIEFSYPKSWGSVQVDKDEQPKCVGPLAIGVGLEGDYSQGDGDLISSRNGYFIKNGKYYQNWFKDHKDGPYEIKFSKNSAYLIPTKDSMAVLTSSTYFDFWSTEASINIGKGKYEGFAVSNRRVYKELTDLQKKQETSEIDRVTDATYTLSQIKQELALFVKSVKINK